MIATIWIPDIIDAADCRKLELAAYGDAATVQQWKQLLRDKDAVVVAHGVFDSIAAIKFENKKANVLLVATRPEQRLKGKAKELLTMLAEKDELHLRLPETDINGLTFACKCGFKVDSLERNGYSHCDAINLTKPPRK